jgi:hypothetical protein
LLVLVEAAADSADLARKPGHALLVLGIVFLRCRSAAFSTDAALA